MKNIENSAGTTTQLSPAAEDNIFLRKVISDVKHGIFPNEEILQEVEKIFEEPKKEIEKALYELIIAFGCSGNKALRDKATIFNKKINNK